MHLLSLPSMQQLSLLSQSVLAARNMFITAGYDVLGVVWQA